MNYLSIGFILMIMTVIAGIVLREDPGCGGILIILAVAGIFFIVLGYIDIN